MNIEALDLEAIVLDDAGEEGRVRVRGGLYLPGKIFVEPYRAVVHGFVAAEGMDGVTFAGEPIVGVARLQEPRLVDAIARAADWRNDKDGRLVDNDWASRRKGVGEIAVPGYQDALRDLRERNIPVADFI